MRVSVCAVQPVPCRGIVNPDEACAHADASGPHAERVARAGRGLKIRVAASLKSGRMTFMQQAGCVLLLAHLQLPVAEAQTRQKDSTMPDTARAREIGVEPGVFEPGPLNAITDVAGVLVGQVTRIEGDSTRTGVTAIRAHAGNLFQDKVSAGLAVANGFGKLAGSTQLAELGEIETPIVLTNTLAVGRAMEAVVDWTLRQPGNAQVKSVNAVVGETNDGTLNDIRGRGVIGEEEAQGRDRVEVDPAEVGAQPGVTVQPVGIGHVGVEGWEDEVDAHADGAWLASAVPASGGVPDLVEKGRGDGPEDEHEQQGRVGDDEQGTLGGGAGGQSQDVQGHEGDEDRDNHGPQEQRGEQVAEGADDPRRQEDPPQPEDQEGVGPG